EEDCAFEDEALRRRCAAQSVQESLNAVAREDELQLLPPPTGELAEALPHGRREVGRRLASHVRGPCLTPGPPPRRRLRDTAASRSRRGRRTHIATVRPSCSAWSASSRGALPARHRCQSCADT